MLAYAHRILTAATPFCSLLPPLAALANVPLYTREPWGMGMRIAVTSTPNFGTKFGWRWLRPRRVGPLGLLAMTMVFCHSEERSDVGIRPFYDGRGFGPPGSSAPADAVWGVPRERHAGVVVPYGSITGGAKRWADVGIGPYGETGRFPQPPGPAAHSGASAPADGRDEKKSEQRSSPKGLSTSDNPSVSLRLTAPFAQGSLGDGGCGSP